MLPHIVSEVTGLSIYSLHGLDIGPIYLADPSLLRSVNVSFSGRLKDSLVNQ
jgi:hypothetical protein